MLFHGQVKILLQSLWCCCCLVWFRELRFQSWSGCRPFRCVFDEDRDLNASRVRV